MAETRRRAGFAQETKPRQFVSKIFFADDFQCHGASKIDVERFVSDSHRTATQLERFPVFADYYLIMLEIVVLRLAISAWPRAQKKTRRTQRHQRVPPAACTPDRIPLLRKTHYRNSGRRVCPPFS